jgi:beta-glucosidase
MGKTPPYKDEGLPIERRVEDLLGRMTLEEKVAQLGSVNARRIVLERRFSAPAAKDLLKEGIGQITRIGGLPGGISLPEASRVICDMQRYIARHTRLGIPALVHEECLSGLMARGATTFPQAIGLASTWDPALMSAVTDVIRRQIRAIGSVQGLAPVLDVLRDPRWGRTEETLGEDPYLVARMGAAYIEGLQGADLRTGVAATPKHFAAHGMPDGGRNLGSVRVGPREFREVFLFPFEVAVKVAKARSLMNAYHELDGVPCAADRRLLTGVLREEWGFTGFVVSDYGAVRMLEKFHRVARDMGEAAVMALEAGIDVELPSAEYYGAPLLEALRAGRISAATVDESVRRVLRGKFELGLFDQTPQPTRGGPTVFDTPSDRAVARRAALESIVLLKNEGVLPLGEKVRTVALVGPHADNARLLFGDYAYTAHVSEVNEIAAPTILEAVRRRLGRRVRVLHAKGCEVMGRDRSGFDEAAAVAAQADVVIACVGDRSELFARGTVGEASDRPTLDLPGVQEDLVAAVSGKPVVLVHVGGRPATLTRLIDRCAAIVEAWFPGEEGAEALTDVLVGRASPSGKLPLSFPRSAGEIPVHYNRRPSAFGVYVDADVVPPAKVEPKALFPFGHGLSYTTFRYSGLSIAPKKTGPVGQVAIRCRVTNTGKRAGDEVVQLYIADEVASVSRPVKELKGFQRVSLKPRETKVVTFRLSLDQLAFYDRDLRLVVEPGTFRVMVGSSSEDIRLEGTFEVTGEAKVVRAERTFFSVATVE